MEHNVDLVFAYKVVEKVKEKVMEIERIANSYYRSLKTIVMVLGYGDEFWIYPKDVAKRYFSINSENIEDEAKKVDLVITYNVASGHISAYWRGELVVDMYENRVRSFKPRKDFLEYVDKLYKRAEEKKTKKEIENALFRARKLAEAFGIDINEVMEEVRKELEKNKQKQK